MPPSTPAADRPVVITGAAGGLGAATARLFADRGWPVVAADLRPPALAPGITPLPLDVTDADSVVAFAGAVRAAAPDGVAAVVNFAGVMRLGALVDVDEAVLRDLLDVNVLGTYRVNKALFASVAAARGRIVTISSEVGWQSALMLNGPYAMSKHAIEAYSDALRRELMFVGVKVIKIQPGAFGTDMVSGIPAAFAAAEDSASPPFRWLVRRVGQLAAGEQERAGDPADLAEVVWTAVTSRRPRAAYSVGADRRRTVLSRLPTRVADLSLRLMLRPPGARMVERVRRT